MAELNIKFAHWVHSQVDEMPHTTRPHGPIFTHWLPDGEKDAIQLRTDSPDVSIWVWFERFGHRPSNLLIEFDEKKREADPGTIARQSCLDAGPLHGRLHLQQVPDETIDVLRRGDMNDTQYAKLGKQIAKLLHVSVNRFLTLLRVNYGQYWLIEIESWDSRALSVGAYCRRWSVRWSTDNLQWSEFKPDEDRTVRLASLYWAESTAPEYLTRDDWEKLKTVVLEDYSPSVAAYLLNRCHRLLSRGETRYALIEGISSLEIALEEHVLRKCDGPLKDQVLNDRFRNMHLVGNMALVAYMVPGIVGRDIEDTAKAIESRNEVIHEGKDPPREVLGWLEAVMRVIARLIGGPGFKFPVYHGFNSLDPPAAT